MHRAHYTFSTHAQKRAQQRGIRPPVIDFVLQYADVGLEAGNGCHVYRISKRAASELRRIGMPTSQVDRAVGVVVLVCEDSGEVVTVMHDHNPQGRRHRRQWPTWSRPCPTITRT
jgi:hypothetical protein